MKVEIIHNGSKWSDEEPNSIEDLMSLLKTEPLNFLAMYREDDCLELVGNFVNVSNVFRVNLRLSRGLSCRHHHRQPADPRA